MKRTLSRALVVALVTMPSGVSAEYKTYGEGASSCGSWVEARRSDTYFDKAQWMLGFVSAAGYYGENPRFTEAKAMVVWMDNYCQTHPLNDFDDGVKALIEELRKKK